MQAAFLFGILTVSIRFASPVGATTIHYIPWDLSDLRGHLLTITTGDKVWFKYANSKHDVVEVTQSQFMSCDTTGVIPPSSGFGSRGTGGEAAIELSPAFEQPGIRYFICSLHCLAGMKITVNIVRAQTTVSRHLAVQCLLCGKLKNNGKLSCCAPGGSWFRKCGNTGDSKFDHTWLEGIEACKTHMLSVTTPPSSTSTCPKCGVNQKNGKRSCCFRGGTWYRNCGDVGNSKFDHTWFDGTDACKETTTPTTSTTIHDVPWDVTVNLRGQLLAVAAGDKVRFQYGNSVHDVVEVRKTQFLNCDTAGVISPSSGFGSRSRGGTDDIELSPPFKQPGIRYFICSLPGHCQVGMKLRVSAEKPRPSSDTECANCGKLKQSGTLSCCAPGGSWFRKCGNVGSTFAHTWLEGIDACKKTPTPIVTAPPSSCPKCGVNKKNGKRSCCLRGGTWFKKCGDPGDKNFVHTWSEGINACTGNPPVTNPPVTNPSSTCPKCGVTKSGKRSCCSRGGTWYRNCGDVGNSKFDHTWSEGIESCNKNPGHVTAPPATPKIPSTCPKCGVAKNGKLSCCFRGGAWFRKCGDVGDSKFDHTWFDGTEACKSALTKPKPRPTKPTTRATPAPTKPKPRPTRPTTRATPSKPCIVTFWAEEEGNCAAGNGVYELTNMVHPGGGDSFEKLCAGNGRTRGRPLKTVNWAGIISMHPAWKLGTDTEKGEDLSPNVKYLRPADGCEPRAPKPTITSKPSPCIVTFWAEGEGDCAAGNGVYELTDRNHPGGGDTFERLCTGNGRIRGRPLKTVNWAGIISLHSPRKLGTDTTRGQDLSSNVKYLRPADGCEPRAPTVDLSKCIVTFWAQEEGNCAAGNGVYELTNMVHPGGGDTFEKLCAGNGRIRGRPLKTVNWAVITQLHPSRKLGTDTTRGTDMGSNVKYLRPADGCEARGGAEARDSVTTATTFCPKCVKKDGTSSSCCFLGGTWFGKCGDPGDTKFSFTWIQGVQACRTGFTFNIGSQARPMGRRRTTIPLNQSTEISTDQIIVSGVRTNNSQGCCDNIQNPITLICLLIIHFYIYV